MAGRLTAVVERPGVTVEAAQDPEVGERVPGRLGADTGAMEKPSTTAKATSGASNLRSIELPPLSEWVRDHEATG